MSDTYDGALRWVLDQNPARAWKVAAALDLSPCDLDALEDNDDGNGTCLVLYEAPWEGCLALAFTDAEGEASPADSWLAEWGRFHARVCAAQLRHPAHIQLVNAGREDAAAVIAGLAGRPHDAEIQSSLQALLPGGISPWSQLLGVWMAETSGTTWRTYETLELAAHSEGRPAEFRLVHRTEGDGRLSAAVRAITQARSAVAESERVRLEDTLDDVQRENTLMALQLEQIHAELQEQTSSEQALHSLVLDAGRAATQARRWIAERIDADARRPA